MAKIKQFSVAKALYYEGKYQYSLETVSALLEREPMNKKALRLKASICRIIGKYTEVVQTCKTLLFLLKNEDELWEKRFLIKGIGNAYE